MSGFNTKTPMMDWSPWMRRDFSAENRGGALADAFKAVGQTADGYGETNDKNLLAGLANETDTSKIPTQDFYSQGNALKAKNLIETNKNLAYQDEQQKRADELNARNDANYYLGVFNKEAMGDALKMDKPTFDAKYANAGGLDWAMMYDTQNKKEDRTFAIEDRSKKNELTNLQMQSTRSQMNRANEEANYLKEQRDTTKQNKENLGNLLSKYSSFEDFKKSEDWSNPQYNYDVKKTFYDSFGKAEKASLTDQIKLEELTNNKKDLPRVQEEYKKTYGLDMPLSEQSKFVYKSELPKDMQTINKKPLSSKDAKELDALLKYKDTLIELKSNHYADSVGGWDNTTSALPEALKTDKARRFEALMNDVLLGKTSALSGTLSDKDMALLKSSGLSQNLGDDDFIKVRDNLMNKVDTLINDKYDLLNESYKMPESYKNIKNNESKSENSQPVITSVRKNNTINTDNKTVIGTGTTPDGKKVFKYSDGSIGYAD